MASGAQLHANGQPYGAETRLVAAAPPWLRWARAVVGLLLLGGAWGASMLALVLAFDVFGASVHQPLLARLALDVACALAILWLGVVALGCLIAGSFCLMLALTTRRW
jgi:hypothetical protein